VSSMRSSQNPSFSAWLIFYQTLSSLPGVIDKSHTEQFLMNWCLCQCFRNYITWLFCFLVIHRKFLIAGKEIRPLTPVCWLLGSDSLLTVLLSLLD
jgi:hypothetical protein